MTAPVAVIVRLLVSYPVFFLELTHIAVVLDFNPLESLLGVVLRYGYIVSGRVLDRSGSRMLPYHGTLACVYGHGDLAHRRQPLRCLVTTEWPTLRGSSNHIEVNAAALLTDKVVYRHYILPIVGIEVDPGIRGIRGFGGFTVPVIRGLRTLALGIFGVVGISAITVLPV